MVSPVELLAELYTCHRKGCKLGYCFPREDEHHRPCVSGQEGATEKFFYMYMCHFSQLHVRLPLDDFTMGVLRGLDVAPTQLHPNSWAYMQTFRILCQSLYLEPSPYAFLYFYDTRPRQLTTWLSLISRPSISRLDAFSQSFKHFKDGYFKVMVKEEGKPYFLNAWEYEVSI